MSLTTELKEHAHKHGIDLIGVTSAEAFKVEDHPYKVSDCGDSGQAGRNLPIFYLPD